MRELHGDIWDLYNFDGFNGNIICITTNGMVNSRGQAVMGRGIALQAAQRWPELPRALGHIIIQEGNHVHWLSKYRVFTFPVKHHWKQKADLELIQRSCTELVQLCNDICPGVQIFMVRPGCGNGQLSWEEVQPHIAPLLDDRFTVVEWR